MCRPYGDSYKALKDMKEKNRAHRRHPASPGPLQDQQVGLAQATMKSWLLPWVLGHTRPCVCHSRVKSLFSAVLWSPRSRAVTKSSRLWWRRSGERSYLTPEVRGSSWEGQPHVQGEAAAQAQEGWDELLHVQGQEGGREEIPLTQGKEQRLYFAGAAVKRYPMSRVRETQARW